MKTYEGIPPHMVVVHEHVPVEGTEVALRQAYELAHVIKHSPTGFSWGYHGSGPAELARCILIDVVGPQGRCTSCDGVGQVKVGGLGDGAWHSASCVDCGGEGYLLMPACYQAFKAELLAPLKSDEGWVLAEADIVAWLGARLERGEPVLRERVIA